MTVGVLRDAVGFIGLGNEHGNFIRLRVEAMDTESIRLGEQQRAVHETDWIIESVVAREHALDRCAAEDHARYVVGDTDDGELLGAKPG